MSASRTRDHLANERTLLAWVRTSITLVALGLAIIKFIDTKGTLSFISGLVMFSTGMLVLFHGMYRYHRINRQIEATGHIMTGSGGIEPLLSAGIMAFAMVVGVILLLVK